MSGRQSFRLLLNRRHGTPGVTVLPEQGFRRARAAIESWPGFAPTPLRDLPDEARAANVAAIHWKDESGRCGIGSFKALGGAHAVTRVIQRELSQDGTAATPAALMAGEMRDAAQGITVACATDGNHGRSVAWGAERCGARCVVFVHPGVSPGRRAAIARFGAEVREVPGTYDDSVRECASVAEREGWTVVSDTSWPGYLEIPRDVMQGYRIMAAEALEALTAPPTHVFIQAGVGGVAAAVSVQLRAAHPEARLIVVEPDQAACLLASAEAGRAVALRGDLATIMAGLACGEPSLLAWQELERAAFAFLAIPDAAAIAAMRDLDAAGIEAGESGTAGLAALRLVAAEPYARAALGLDTDSRVLLFGTEGATDPAVRDALLASRN